MNAEKKERRSPRLRWKILLWLLGFTAVIVLLLWLCQSVFLEDIYKTVKTVDVKRGAQKLVDRIDSSELAKTVDLVAQNSDACVLVVDLGTDPNRPIALYSDHCIDDCVIHSIDGESIMKLVTSAQNNGGEELQRFVFDSSTRRYIGITGGFFENGDGPDGREYPESIIYTVICEKADGTQMCVIVNSSVSPVGATVKTLNMMLIAITVVLIGIAVLLAFVISRRISRPIARITASARELAQGDYDVEFRGGSYREIYELSDALNYAEGELAKTDSLRRELIANISHDLRTPLTMITGYGEVMRDIPGENTPENLQIIIDESKRLASLVNDLLDVSRVESGVEKNDPRPFDITASVSRTLERFAKFCEKDGYTIEFYRGEAEWVCADEERVTQAIYNLVCNAITYTGADKKIVVTQDSLPEGVRISVTDTGDGIPQDQLAHVWERYYRAGGDHKRAETGNGLGLSIVKNVMKLNGGTCGAQSRPGEGSTFWIELPRYTGNTGPKE